MLSDLRVKQHFLEKEMAVGYLKLLEQLLWTIHSRRYVTWLTLEKRILGKYRVNADLSRFREGLSIVELVEHSFMCNLIMSNIIGNYI